MVNQISEKTHICVKTNKRSRIEVFYLYFKIQSQIKRIVR